MATGMVKEPHVIIYPSADQLYESNIGLNDNEPHTLPTVISKANRIVLFYDGSYEHLNDQLKEALVRSVWESQVKEGLSAQAKGKDNNTDIPFWFKEGAIRFFAHKWPLEQEDDLKRSFKDAGFNNWQQVIGYEPRLSGQAFCYFLSEQYYPQAVLQTFQQLRKKNLTRSLRLITKTPIDSLYYQCFEFYKQRFEKEIETVSLDSAKRDKEETSLRIPRKKGIIKNVQISDDGYTVAYVVSKNNNRAVYIYDQRIKKVKRVTSYKLPPWINDYSKDLYPVIQWDKDELLVTMPVKGKLRVKGYSIYGSKLDDDEIKGIDGINNIEPVSRQDFTISGWKKGQSDIVKYNTYKEQYAAYTKDGWDDGKMTMGSNDPYFVSSRTDKKAKDTSVLYQGIYTIRDTAVIPVITDTISYVRYDDPLWLKNNNLLITETKTGTKQFAVINPRSGTIQTAIAGNQPVQYNATNNSIVTYKVEKDTLVITQQPLDKWIPQNKSSEEQSPWLKNYLGNAAAQAKEDSLLKAIKDNNKSSFLDGVLVPKDAEERSKKRNDSIAEAESYSPRKVKPYILQLHSAYFSAKVNNDYFMNRYQPYLNYQGQYKFPEVGGMAQGGFSDLFEDHHVNIAFRIPAATEGSMFFFKYLNTAKKLDWGLTYYRDVETLKPDPQRNWTDDNGKPYPNLAKVKTYYYEVNLHYPITYELGIDFNQGFRNDRTIFQATDNYSLPFEDIKSLWSITSLSMHWNKLKPTIPLLYKGFEVKANVDAFKGFSQDEQAVLGTGITISYDQPLYKYITLVTSIKAGYSIGQGKVLYQLAGIDNMLNPKVDSNVHFDQKAPYAFQTLITPFRGYIQNTLYGNEYALLNADVYFPIFQTLYPIETPLPSVNTLQPGLFIDAATAKETWNKTGINKGILWSYGFSMRTTLAGYPIRFDMAWPGTFGEKPVWYLSLTLK